MNTVMNKRYKYVLRIIYTFTVTKMIKAILLTPAHLKTYKLRTRSNCCQVTYLSLITSKSVKLHLIPLACFLSINLRKQGVYRDCVRSALVGPGSNASECAFCNVSESR